MEEEEENDEKVEPIGNGDAQNPPRERETK